MRNEHERISNHHRNVVGRLSVYKSWADVIHPAIVTCSMLVPDFISSLRSSRAISRSYPFESIKLNSDEVRYIVLANRR